MKVYLAVYGENSHDGHANFIGVATTYDGAESIIQKHEAESIRDKRKGEPRILSADEVKFDLCLEFKGVEKAWYWPHPQMLDESYYILEAKVS